MQKEYGICLRGFAGPGRKLIGSGRTIPYSLLMRLCVRLGGPVHSLLHIGDQLGDRFPLRRGRLFVGISDRNKSDQLPILRDLQ